MKKFQINSQNNEPLISVIIPSVGKNLSPLQRILEVATYLRIKLVFIMLLLLPTSIFMFSNISKVGFESSIFLFLITIILLIIGLYISEVVLAGSKKLIDPPGMLNVLIFALLATTSAVLIPLKSSENTFGTVSEISVKGITGISVIIFLCLFYFVMLLIKTKVDFQKILSILNFSGIIFFSTFLTFFGYEFSTTFVANYNEINLFYFAHIAFTAIAIFQFIFRKGLSSKFVNIYALLISLLFFITLNPNPILVSLSLLVTGIVMSLFLSIFILKHSEEIKSLYNVLKTKVKLLLKNIKTKQEIDFSEIYSLKMYLLKIILLISGPVILVVSTLIILNNPAAKEYIELVLKDISTAITAISSDGTKLATGLGASVFDGTNSLVSGIVRSNGLIGTLAYAVIFFSVIWVIFGDLSNKKFFKSDLYKVKGIVYFLVIFGLITFFIIYPGLIFLSVWWMMFALVFGFKAISSSSNKKHEIVQDDYEFEIVEFSFGNKVFGKNGKFAKLFITGIIFTAFVIIAVVSVSLAGRIV